MSAGLCPLKLGGIATPSPHMGGGAFVFRESRTLKKIVSRKDAKNAKLRNF
jgi:hypothetical protein